MISDSQIERLKEMRRLYEEESSSLQEIAARFGVSKQAIHERLTKAGVTLRAKKRKAKSLDIEQLTRLYIEEELTIEETAKRLKTNCAKVSSELERHKIEKRPRGYYLRKQLELETLEIGRNVIIPRPSVKQPYTALYIKAKNIGIRISIKSLDKDTFEVTRIGDVRRDSITNKT